MEKVLHTTYFSHHLTATCSRFLPALPAWVPLFISYSFSLSIMHLSYSADAEKKDSAFLQFLSWFLWFCHSATAATYSACLPPYLHACLHFCHPAAGLLIPSAWVLATSLFSHSGLLPATPGFLPLFPHLPATLLFLLPFSIPSCISSSSACRSHHSRLVTVPGPPRERRVTYLPASRSHSFTYHLEEKVCYRKVTIRISSSLFYHLPFWTDLPLQLGPRSCLGH